jgi:general secretion pathway protein A
VYESFYNLAEKPFDLTHSSRFLYLGEAHKEALAMLTYGLWKGKGFVLLTGEVGTGKTTIVHALLSELDKSVQCVYLANPTLSPKEFMNYLTLSAFKNRITFKSKAEFLLAFEGFSPGVPSSRGVSFSL